MIEKRKTKKGTLYRAKCYAGKDADGKQRVICGSLREKLIDAKRDELMLMEKAEALKNHTEPDKVTTFGEAVASFKRSKKYETYSQRTKDDIEYWLGREITSTFGKAKLTSIRPMVLEAWLEEMSAKWSRSTYSKPWNIVKTILKYCRKREYILTDPTEGVEMPTKASHGKALASAKDLPVWTPDQITAFMSWDKVKTDYTFPMLRLSFEYGLRPGEVCGIKVKDVTLKKITISQGFSATRQQTDLKTENSHRDLPISSDIYVLLSRYTRKDPDEYLFKNTSGNTVAPDTYSKRFQKLLKEYNNTHVEKLPQMPLYNARHSWSTNAKYVYHIDPAVRASVLGHTTIDTSDENYTKITIEEISRQIFQKVK